MITQTEALKDFDWDLYENENNSKLKKNNFIKTKPGDIVYSHSSYAPDAYNLYSDKLDNTSIKLPTKGELYNALIVGINNKTAYLDINYKEYIYLDLNKENKQYLQELQVGQYIDIKILNNKSDKTSIRASFSDAIKTIKENEIKDSIGKPYAYKAYIKELINGGFIVTIDEVECFMPGSQITVNKIDNFSDFVGKEVIVMPINYSTEKQTIVVSSRAYLKTLIPIELDKLKDNIDKKYKGIITGSAKFGIFCEFNECLTGLIHISDLDEETQIKHKERTIKNNDQIEFYIKEILKDGKILLTQVIKNDPWSNIEEKYKIQSIATGKVISIKEYGAFIELEKGLSGLLHINEFANLELNEGDLINVKITRIEKSSKKIAFTILK